VPAIVRLYINPAWQLPLALAVLALWLGGGTFLLRRAVRNVASRRLASTGRCFAVTGLGCLLALLAAAAGFFLVRALGAQWDTSLVVLPALTAGAAFYTMGFFVPFATYRFTARQTFRVFLVAFVLPSLPVLAAAVPAGVVSYHFGQQEFRRLMCLQHLHGIYTAMWRSYLGHPPPSLQRVVQNNVLRQEETECPAAPDGQAAYFYLPTSVLVPRAEARTDAAKEAARRAARRLLACDRGCWHGGRRNIVFANGDFRSVTEEEFRKVLADPENAEFASALSGTADRARWP